MASNDSESIPPEVAMQLYTGGAFLIVKDFIGGTNPQQKPHEFGIDYKSWTVGAGFLGVKMIPPGVHFIYAGGSGGSVNAAPYKVGFFHNFQPQEVLVVKWNREEESFAADYHGGEEEIERIRANLKTLDSSLGPYPYSCYRQWISLSSNITERTLRRLDPSSGKSLALISSQVELETKEQELERVAGDGFGTSIVDREHSTRIRLTDNQGLPIMQPTGSAVRHKVRFTSIPQISLAECCNRQTAGIDNSERLYSLLEEYTKEEGASSSGSSSLPDAGKELLAEFQYAFITFLVGHLYEGFEQWKRIIHLLCSCQRALRTHPRLFLDFLMMFHFQLKTEGENDGESLLGTGAIADNFLTSTLSLLFANISDHVDSGGRDTEGRKIAPKPLREELKTKAGKFRLLLEKIYGRSFELPN